MITVVVPCYNESAVLVPLYHRLTAAAESWNEPFEILLVDDGSDAETWQQIDEIHGLDPRWKAVRFSRNFGHQTAVSVGLRYASGDAVVVIDADLQDPPEQIGRLIARWREGYDVVYAVRRKRKEGLFRRFCYAAFYRLLAGMSDTPIPLDSGDFCLMDRKVVDVLNAMPEHKRFVRGLRAWVGFRQIGVEYERKVRIAGRTHYTLGKLAQLAADGIFSSSTLPLRLAARLGLVVCLIALLATALVLAQPMFGHQVASGAATLIAVLFLGGVQLICLGILGEYIGRIYEEVRGRPQGIVSQTLGFESPAETGSADASSPWPWIAEGRPVVWYQRVRRNV